MVRPILLVWEAAVQAARPVTREAVVQGAADPVAAADPETAVDLAKQVPMSLVTRERQEEAM